MKRPGSIIGLIRRMLVPWIFSAVLFGEFCGAGEVDSATAVRLVDNWLAGRTFPLAGDCRRSVSGETVPVHRGTVSILFAVSLEPDGYCLVAPDDRVEPIVCFSATGRFDPASSGPLQDLVRADMTRRLAALESSASVEGQSGRSSTEVPGEAARVARAKWELLLAGSGERRGYTGVVADERVAPLVQTEWGQGAVSSGACFNYYTPPGPNGSTDNCVSGCVATVLAQIMRFHQYPEIDVGTDSFVVEVDGQPESRSLRGGDGSGGAYQWNDMPYRPADSATETERRAIGAVCYDAAVATNMSFSADLSTTTDFEARNALVSTFMYGSAVLGRTEMLSVDGTDFTNMILPGLDAALPLLLGLDGAYGGHSVICDGYGYDTDTLYYHLNMGWQGADNLWYDLPYVDAAGSPFSAVTDCVYNISPALEGACELVSGRVLDAAGSPLQNVTVNAEYSARRSAAAVTDENGIFAFSAVPPDSEITLSAFVPGSLVSPRRVTTGTSVSNSSKVGSRWGIDLKAFADPVDPVISGYVQTRDGRGVAGVTVTAGGGIDDTVTDDSGAFILTVPQGWSGTVTPTMPQWGIEPAFREFWEVNTDELEQIFVAREVIFVDADSIAAQPDGSSWSKAFRDLSDALVIVSSTSEIWLAEGEYTPGSSRASAFEVFADTAIYGGFSGNESLRAERDVAANPTILSGEFGQSGDPGDNVYHVLLVYHDLVLDGVSITGGVADAGGAESYGAGIFCGVGEGSMPALELTDVTFRDNVASSLGGAIYCADADTIFKRCVFTANSALNGAAGGFTGGIQLFGGCVFLCNHADSSGGGLFMQDADTAMYSCLFAENEAASYGGGAVFITGTAEIVNCTFSENRAQVGGAGALFAQGLTQFSLTNCILRADTSPEIYNAQGSVLPDVACCCIDGSGGSGRAWNSALGYDQGGNLDTDPLFVDPADPDGPDQVLPSVDDGFALRESSPCVDAGASVVVPETDILGRDRQQLAGVDMGAYERPRPPYWTVQGTIQYSGPVSGLVWVQIFDTGNFDELGDLPISEKLIGTSRNWSYQVDDLPETDIWIRAFIDADDDVFLDPEDPAGYYHGNPVQLTSDLDGADITLLDPDNDSDTMPDWWELEFFGTTERDGEGDYDGDGETDAEEAAGQTAPDDARSATAPENVYDDFHFGIVRTAPQAETPGDEIWEYVLQMICSPLAQQQFSAGELSVPDDPLRAVPFPMAVSEEGTAAEFQSGFFQDFSLFQDQFPAGTYRVGLVTVESVREDDRLRFSVNVPDYTENNFPVGVRILSPQALEQDVSTLPLLEFSTEGWDRAECALDTGAWNVECQNSESTPSSSVQVGDLLPDARWIQLGLYTQGQPGTRLETCLKIDFRTVFRLDFSAGWNLISLPLELDDPSLSALFSYSPGNPGREMLCIEPAWTWETQNSGARGYVMTDQIPPGQGTWVFMNEQGSIEIPGTLTGNRTINLETGWNLLGPLVEDDLLFQPMPPISPDVYSWNENDYRIAEFLLFGRGYWLFSDQPTQITWDERGPSLRKR